ncbi:hypothetical protein GMOD_00009607 [Pyrenophora seminiperda CCB06]|uniref:Uncharacterized protein n=1 Tax=Pyrenophora seminiperda CCB06 TaxID=1302712 RepID=A0A3M7MFF0_9PLEO|nr:hypothetical protein GMOD_00009607 [Pyrenophora seminiperda CCB06]
MDRWIQRIENPPSSKPYLSYINTQNTRASPHYSHTSIYSTSP